VEKTYLDEFWFPGQTGLGKSTLINTIFASHLIDSKGRREADEPVRQTTEIQTVSHGAVISLLLLLNVVTLHFCDATHARATT
jgi:septin family protein